MEIIPRKVQLTADERKYVIQYLKATRNFDTHPAHHHAVESLKNEDTFVLDNANTFWIPSPNPPRERIIMGKKIFEGAIGVGLPKLKVYFRDIGFIRGKRHTVTINGNVYAVT